MNWIGPVKHSATLSHRFLGHWIAVKSLADPYRSTKRGILRSRLTAALRTRRSPLSSSGKHLSQWPIQHCTTKTYLVTLVTLRLLHVCDVCLITRSSLSAQLKSPATLFQGSLVWITESSQPFTPVHTRSWLTSFSFALQQGLNGYLGRL